MPNPLREVPQDAVELIKSFEGIPDGDPSTVTLDAYLDPLDIWTIGWGHAVQYLGKHLKGKDNRTLARQLYPGGITRAQAESLLRADLLDRAPAVLRLVKVALDDGQFGALMSFVFNAGGGNFERSTLLRLLNAGDRAGAADQFLVWNMGRRNGVLVELPGLTRRRRAERALFLGEDWRAASTPTPAVRGGPALPRGAGPRSGATKTRRPAPERPVAPSAARQRAAARASARASAERVRAAAGVTPHARTTRATSPRPAAPARRRAPRTAR
jgi:GH24 family phage-related lysozyme (muramidase)